MIKKIINFIYWFIPIKHIWAYHNPYDRKCRICGLHEVYYSSSWESRYGWWEEYNSGNLNKHRYKNSKN